MATLVGQLLDAERPQTGQILGFILLGLVALIGVATAASALLVDSRKRVEVIAAGLVALVAVSLLSIMGFGLRLLPFIAVIALSWVMMRKELSKEQPEAPN